MTSVTAIEVVREGRFQWQVKWRRPAGFDSELEQPCMFRWTAERVARRAARREARAEMPPGAVLRIPVASSGMTDEDREWIGQQLRAVRDA